MDAPAIEALAEMVAERAAKKTVAQTFRALGVDICDQRSLNEFRADLVHARGSRQRRERGAIRRERMPLMVGVAAVTALVAALASLARGLLWGAG